MDKIDSACLTIFADALEIDVPQRRAAFLDQACGTDAALRRDIEELIEAQTLAGRFLPDQPGASDSQAALMDGAEALAPRATRLQVAITEKPGDLIGRYRLLQKIGEGGCGVVYLAEQEEPIRRKVALKVIKLGMDTKSVVARFEAERQALALMDHRNIAKVLDAGATETGRPFFVMELVRGIRITQYCDRHELPTRDRLELFMQVCQAVQHAHQKGIIHRDLKPSNVLVTVNDGLAVPKVIDFGIAKATEGRLTKQALFTAFEQFLGTPAYTSPEQAAMTILDIDTRTDIYSLGVLLYELLTGVTPLDADTLRAGTLEEVRAMIRESDPPKPSTRLLTMGGMVVEVARCRHADPAGLTRLVQGDLDSITMKCLEKDRQRRYASVNGLAMDVERHLNNEPVIARPTSNLYRFQKLVRRNKLFLAAGAAVIAALLIGFVISMWLLLKEKAARRNAVAAESRALAEMGKSKQSVEFLRELLHRFGPVVAKDHDTAQLKEALDGLAWQVQPDLLNKPELQQNLLCTIALIYSDFGENQKAEEMARRALGFARKRPSQEGTLSAEPLRVLRDVLMEEHKYAEARELFEGSLPQELGLKSGGAELLQIRGDLWARTGDWNKALADFSKLAQLEPENHESYYSLAPLLVQTGQVAAYQQLCRQMLSRFGRTTNDSNMAQRMGKVCLLLPWGEELTMAASLADLSVTLGEGRINEPWCQFAKGFAEYRRGRYPSAADWMQRVQAQKILPGQGRRRHLSVQSYAVLAMARHQLGKADEARAALAQAFAIAEEEMPQLEGGDLKGGWREWLMAYALMKEAKALIQPPTVTPREHQPSKPQG